MSQNATNMRKLMESINPAPEMDMADIPVDNMGAMDNNGDMDAQMGGGMPDMGAEMPDMGGEEVGVSTDIIDALEGEFKRLTTDFLQTGGELDEAGLSDVREKLGKHMTSILDVLHSGWMDNMMDQGANKSDDSESETETPNFMPDSDDDNSDDETDDHEASETDDEEAEEKAEGDDDDSDDKDDSGDNDDDSDDKDDSGEKGEEYNFDEAHLNENANNMAKMRNLFLKG